MKNLLSLLAVAGIVAGFAAPANADEFVARYTYLVNGAQLPAAQVLSQPAVINNACPAQVLTQPAVVEACPAKVLTQPAVVDACPTVISQPAVLTKPIMVEDHETINPHFFHLGLWPLIDFSIF
jgi:hypothetical protein